MPGDANENNWIEQGDLDRVLANWGMGSQTFDATWSNGDTNGNGWVEQGDLNNVLTNWGLCYKDWLATGGCGLCESPNGAASVQSSLLEALDDSLQRLGLVDLRAALELTSRTLDTDADRQSLSNDLAKALDAPNDIRK
jgi:hypothetical protein